MPLVDLNYSYGDDAPPSFGGVDLTPPEPADKRPMPGFSDLAGASLRINSDIVSPFTSATFGVDAETPDDGFDIGDELRGTPYENRVEFVGVRNRKAMDAVKVQLEQERRDRETIEAAGVLGTAMDFGSSMASWTMALPGGAFVKSAKRGYSALRSAAMVGTAAAVAGAASEATLQSSQVSRPMSETYTTIGASFLLGGVLGGVASQLTRGEWSDLVSRTDSAFGPTNPVEPSRGFAGSASAGAATIERGSDRLKDEGLFKKLGFRLGNKAFGLNEQDPMIRLQLSELGEARTAVRDLAESPLELQANREGFATSDGGTVETRIKTWQAPLYRAVSNLDDAYARYFFGKEKVGTLGRMSAPLRSEVAARRGTSEKMTFKDFKEEVGRAMSRDDTHPVPEIEEVARAARVEVLDRGRKAAVDAGLFGKEMADIKSAGYLHRIYNRQKIIARRGDFKGRLTDYLERGRVDAERREAELQAANLAVKMDEAQRRVTRLSKQVASKSRTVDRAEGTGSRTQGQITAARERLQAIRTRARDVQDREAAKPLREAIRRAKSGKSLPLPKSPVLDILVKAGGVVRGSPLARNSKHAASPRK